MARGISWTNPPLSEVLVGPESAGNNKDDFPLLQHPGQEGQSGDRPGDRPAKRTNHTINGAGAREGQTEPSIKTHLETRFESTKRGWSEWRDEGWTGVIFAVCLYNCGRSESVFP